MNNDLIINTNYRTEATFENICSKTIMWLTKINAKIETKSPLRITATHLKLFPSFLSKIYIKHFNPINWDKRISFSFSRTGSITQIELQITSLEKDLTHNESLKSWWSFFVIDYASYMNLETQKHMDDRVSTSSMKKELIKNSYLVYLSVIWNMLLGIFFFMSMPNYVGIVLGVLLFLNAIIIGLDYIKSYEEAISFLHVI